MQTEISPVDGDSAPRGAGLLAVSFVKLVKRGRGLGDEVRGVQRFMAEHCSPATQGCECAKVSLMAAAAPMGTHDVLIVLQSTSYQALLNCLATCLRTKSGVEVFDSNTTVGVLGATK